MKPLGINLTRVFVVLITFVISSTLVASNWFYYASLTPFLLFIQGISLLILFSGSVFFFRKDIALSINITHVLVIAFGAYILINGLSFNSDYNSYHTYLLYCCGLLLCTSLLVKAFPGKLYVILSIVLALAMLESVICIGQWLGMLNSQNHFFRVTGTWSNPNVTAMFIVMAAPALFAIKNAPNKFGLNVAITCFLTICLSLILLNCRTAWVALAIILVIYINRHYHLLSLFKYLKRSYQVVTCMAAIGLVLLAGVQLYNHKKSSADGRLLIWKISAQMVQEKPLTGFGYGMFEREYNLHQANYFKLHKGTAREKANAGFVHMGYNEFLQNTVEGGAIGLMLLCGLFYALLRLPVFKQKETKDKNVDAYIAAYCGVLVFALMSLINFTIQAIPAMCVFVIYGAILTSAPYQRQLLVVRHANNSRANAGVFNKMQLIGSLLVAGGLWLSYSAFQTIIASYINKQATSQANAMQLLQPLANGLYHYESYWTNYGNILLNNRDYKRALVKYDHAKLLTSNPDLYFKSGICYERLDDKENAVKNYQQSAWLDPNRIQPHFALMRLYWRSRDTASAINAANEIITMPVKVATKRAYYYQHQALQLLKQASTNVSPVISDVSINQPSTINY